MIRQRASKTHDGVMNSSAHCRMVPRSFGFSPAWTRTALVGIACALGAHAQATVVQFDTPLGSFQVDLFDNTAPNTVANFLNYVNDGDYTNSFVHRSVQSPTFKVVQGGGFTATPGPDPAVVATIPTDPPILDENLGPNVRGTIAMAKSGPNTATSQWFINVTDNPSLDNPLNFGGFTTFGVVTDNGMAVVDAINQATTYVFQPPFGELPLLNYDGFSTVLGDNLIFTNITVVPEAATSVLFLIGLGCVGSRRTGSRCVQPTSPSANNYLAGGAY